MLAVMHRSTAARVPGVRFNVSASIILRFQALSAALHDSVCSIWVYCFRCVTFCGSCELAGIALRSAIIIHLKQLVYSLL